MSIINNLQQTSCELKPIHKLFRESTHNQFSLKVPIEKMESLVNYESDDIDAKITTKNRSKVSIYIFNA